jgi:hypothetical protein
MHTSNPEKGLIVCYPMTISVKTRGGKPATFDPFMWGAFILYALLLGYAMMHHELWGDEVHSWNIAKGSGSYSDMIANRRYEGHPPAWYTVLWIISRFTHNVVCMQAAQWLVAVSVAFMMLFHSPFGRGTRMLLPFGYYFLFEYGVLSRNYALGILFACGICLIMRKEFRYKTVLYYVLLFCMSNVHLLALLLAASLHLYFLLLKLEQKKSVRTVLTHILAGALVLLPAVYFIFPPSDGSLNIHYWAGVWNIHQLSTPIEIPLRSLLPVPAWWKYHFWNTECLLEAKKTYPLLKFINPLVALGLLVWVFYILRANKKSLTLFSVNCCLSFIVSVTLFSLASARYSGFVFIGFIAAAWLYLYETPPVGRHTRMINVLLIIQLAGGLFAVSNDIRFPFSEAYKIPELIKEVPAGQKWVTDYWTMNEVEAYTDHPAYCIDLQKSVSFLLWDGDLTAMLKKPNRYSDGLGNFFQKEGIKSVYMVTQASPSLLRETDTTLSTYYRMTLIDKREGAIERGSDLYLYQISSF